MNIPATDSAGAPRRGLHPLVAIASVAVIALCAVAIAAIVGWLPGPHAQQEGPGANDAASGTISGPESANMAPVPGQPAAPQRTQPAPPPPQYAQPAPQPPQYAQPATAPRAAPTPPAVAQPQPAPAAPQPVNCPDCGVVTSMNTVQVPAGDNSNHIIGTVAGGVVGGVVGNQFGGGNGRTALTVLGAVGGALAGREVESNIRKQQTVTRYQLVVRTNDGRTHTFRSSTPYSFQPGQHVRVQGNQVVPQ
jgi:outer membrane lipoprotein SlyB